MHMLLTLPIFDIDEILRLRDPSTVPITGFCPEAQRLPL